MKQQELSSMSVSQLVDAFVSMALAQDEAELADELATYNRIYDEMETVRHELKSREGDARRALLPLLAHRNAQVRLKAAISTLALEPEAARETLQKLADSNEFPQAARASGMLEAIAEGRYVPS